MSTGQSGVMLCGWGAKPGMVNSSSILVDKCVGDRQSCVIPR